MFFSPQSFNSYITKVKTRLQQYFSSIALPFTSKQCWEHHTETSTDFSHKAVLELISTCQWMGLLDIIVQSLSLTQLKPRYFNTAWEITCPWGKLPILITLALKLKSIITAYFSYCRVWVPLNFYLNKALELQISELFLQSWREAEPRCKCGAPDSQGPTAPVTAARRGSWGRPESERGTEGLPAPKGPQGRPWGRLPGAEQSAFSWRKPAGKAAWEQTS